MNSIMFVTQITGVTKQILDVAHHVIEDSTTRVHAVRELIIWVTVQVSVLLFPFSLKGLQAYIAKFENSAQRNFWVQNLPQGYTDALKGVGFFKTCDMSIFSWVSGVKQVWLCQHYSHASCHYTH